MRRGSTSSVPYRRAMMLLAPAGGNRVPVIAQLGAELKVAPHGSMSGCSRDKFSHWAETEPPGCDRP
ncbi:hypothetical protein [Streptomyces canus]|uniref:hypothetical protein n=1 Tax=Streptomyces canus TaxID=58343 RepID=UPI0036EF20B2